MPRADQYDDLERLAHGMTRVGAMPEEYNMAWGRGRPHATHTDLVRQAQSRLIAHGFAPGHAPNGQLTIQTKDAIKAFQAKNPGLRPTGTLDAPTIQKLHGAPTPSTLGPKPTSQLQGGLVPITRSGGGTGPVRKPPPKPGGLTGGPARPPGGVIVPGRPGRPVMHPAQPPKAPSAPPAARPSGAGLAGFPAGAGASRGGGVSGGFPAASIQPAPRGAQARGQTMEYGSAGKRVPIVFSSSGTVAASTQVDIVVTPQLPFRVEAMVVDATTAANFSTVQLKIGVVPQNAGGSGNIPATTFPPTQTAAVAFECDLADAGTTITWTVINNDTAAHSFVGTLWGHEIKAA